MPIGEYWCEMMEVARKTNRAVPTGGISGMRQSAAASLPEAVRRAVGAEDMKGHQMLPEPSPADKQEHLLAIYLTESGQEGGY